MQTLQEVQKSFNSMGFSPKQEPFNRRILCIFVITFPAVVANWIFLIYEVDTASEYMESIYIVTTGTGVFLSFASTILIQKKLFSFVKSHDAFINERVEYSKSKIFLENTNELIEKWSKIIVYVLKYVFTPCFVRPKVVISIFTYFTTDLGNDAFHLPLPMWLPYDWKNPTGYLVSVFIEFVMCLCSCQYCVCLILLAFGGFIFTIAFGKILKNELRSINRMAKRKKLRKNIYEEVSTFIRLHANEKQLVVSFADFYEITLTIVFFCCIITICAGMMMVQIEISNNEIDSIILLEAAVYGASALILLLFVCELGQRFSNVIDEINDVIIQLDWYLFPSEIQRMLPTVMQSAQQPVAIKCFGNVLCARIQFRKVVRITYSYFMVLRKFYK